MPARNASQVNDGWRPDERQAKLLAAAAEAGFRRSIGALAREAGIPPQTAHRWVHDNPDFRRAWDNLPRQMIGAHMPGIIAAQVKRALDGDTHAARLLIEVIGDVAAVGQGTVERQAPRPANFDEWAISMRAEQQGWAPEKLAAELASLRAKANGKGSNGHAN